MSSIGGVASNINAGGISGFHCATRCWCCDGGVLPILQASFPFMFFVVEEGGGEGNGCAHPSEPIFRDKIISIYIIVILKATTVTSNRELKKVVQYCRDAV